MQNKSDLLLKLLLKNGHAIALYTEENTVDEMVSHPKFLRMRDDGNDVFLSIEDVVAFEILNNRKANSQEGNDKQSSNEQISG